MINFLNQSVQSLPLFVVIVLVLVGMWIYDRRKKKAKDEEPPVPFIDKKGGNFGSSLMMLIAFLTFLVGLLFPPMKNAETAKWFVLAGAFFIGFPVLVVLFAYNTGKFRHFARRFYEMLWLPALLIFGLGLFFIGN